MTTTQRHEIEAFLGDALDQLTSEQVNELVRISDDIHQTWPDPDDADQREAALTAAVQYMLGETTLAQASNTRARARIQATLATAALRQIVVMADAAGQSENSIVRETGVARMTVRDWLGKA